MQVGDGATEDSVYYYGAWRVFFSFDSLAKQIRKKRIPYTVVIGVARPTIINEVSGSFDIKIDTGIRIKNADVIPCIITGILFPQPLK